MRRIRHRLYGADIGDVADMNQRLAAVCLISRSDGIGLGPIAACINQNGRAALRPAPARWRGRFTAGAGDDGDLAAEFVATGPCQSLPIDGRAEIRF